MINKINGLATPKKLDSPVHFCYNTCMLNEKGNDKLKTKAELEAIYNSTERRFSNGTQGEFARRGVHVLKTEEYHVGKQGELRWNSSNNIIPADILEMAVVDGTIDIDELNTTQAVREVEDEIAIRNYINFRNKHGYSEEELMEIEAEFGDEEPVDIFTGREIRTGRFVL